MTLNSSQLPNGLLARPMASANNSGNGADILLINEITSGEIRYIELTSDGLYFVNDGMLYYVANCQDITTSKQLELPDGDFVYFLFQFKDQPWILAGAKIKSLWRKSDGVWQNISDWPYNLPYLYSHSALGVFFLSVRTDDKAAEIYWLDERYHLHQIMPDCDYKNITCIQAAGESLFLGLQNPGKVVELSLTEIAECAESASVVIKIKPKDIAGIQCCNLLCSDSEILYALDGPTRLLDKTGRVVFSDETPRNSGYQVGATATIARRKKWHILGTWRRNEEHPDACLYILDEKCAQRLKLSDGAIGKLKPWTGYNLYQRGFTGQRVAIANNAGAPVIVEAFESLSQLAAREGHQKFEISYASEDLIIFKTGFANIDLQNSDHRHDIAASVLPKSPAAPSNIYITIDVEQHLPGKPYCLTGADLTPVCGIGFIMDTLEKYGLKGVFFVNIYEHPHHPELMRQIIHEIHSRGHEIGLHCHPSPLEFNQKPLTEYPYGEKLKIIEYGMNYIKGITGKNPVSYRGGGYNIDEEALKALAESGIRIDSSLFMAIEQPVKRKTKNALTRYGSLIELPVTSHLLSGAPSKIDINWSATANAMQKQVLACHNHGLQHIVCMLHSFSFLEWTKDRNRALNDFEFTSHRRIGGVNQKLMAEFDAFCRFIANSDSFNTTTFNLALDRGELQADKQWGTDHIPHIAIAGSQPHYCPVCQKSVKEFKPYRNMPGRLCPECNSLERMRLKMLYLRNVLNIENCSPLKILHFGPAACVQKELEKLPMHDYISSDPYSPAHFKFPMEKIPFIEETFDLVIASAVLMHMLDDKKGLIEVRRTLKIGGKLILWVGNLAGGTTQEKYNQDEYTKMVVGDTTIPDDLWAGTVIMKKDMVFYNPRYLTRIYGKDIIYKLKNIGFKTYYIKADIFLYSDIYGIPKDEFLLVAEKQ